MLGLHEGGRKRGGDGGGRGHRAGGWKIIRSFQGLVYYQRVLENVWLTVETPAV